MHCVRFIVQAVNVLIVKLIESIYCMTLFMTTTHDTVSFFLHSPKRLRGYVIHLGKKMTNINILYRMTHANNLKRKCSYSYATV